MAHGFTTNAISLVSNGLNSPDGNFGSRLTTHGLFGGVATDEVLVELQPSMGSLTNAQISNRIYLLTNGSFDIVGIREVLDQQYRSILNTTQWSFVKSDGVLTTRAERTDGTLTATFGSTAVVGSGTAFDSDDVGCLCVLDGLPYVVSEVADTTHLTLNSPYVGTTGSTKAYSLRTHRFDLDADIESLLTHAGTNWALDEISSGTLEQYDPNRYQVGLPRYYAYVPPTTVDRTRIELWPTPITDMRFPYMGLLRGSLSSASQILTDISDVLLKAGLELTCQAIYARTGEAKWLNLIKMYATEFREALQYIKKKDTRRFGKDFEQMNPRAAFEGDPGVFYDERFFS